MIKKLMLATSVSVIALSFGMETVSAQELDVMERPRPEYDPIGLPAGSFVIFPNVEVSERYNDNIFAQQTNEVDDFVTNIRPSVAVNSDWNNHALNFRADANAGIYADNSDEDYFDYGIGTDGRIDILRTANIFGGMGFRHGHEDRGSPDDTVSTEPTEWDRFDAHLGANYNPGDLRFTIEGKYRDQDFDDTVRSTGVVNNNDDRDRETTEGRLRVGYQINPDYQFFVQGKVNERDYDNTPDDNGLNRNSDGWRIDAGVSFQITGTLEGEVFGGYFSQSYEDPAFSDVDDYDAGGRLLWSATPLTTVRASLTRDVVETTTNRASSYVSTIARVGFDHELMRNLLVGGGIAFTNNDYEDITREDDLIRLEARAKYLITRNFYAGATADYTDRDSNTAGNSYERFRIGAFIGAQF